MEQKKQILVGLIALLPVVNSYKNQEKDVTPSYRENKGKTVSVLYQKANEDLESSVLYENIANDSYDSINNKATYKSSGASKKSAGYTLEAMEHLNAIVQKYIFRDFKNEDEHTILQSSRKATMELQNIKLDPMIEEYGKRLNLTYYLVDKENKVHTVKVDIEGYGDEDGFKKGVGKALVSVDCDTKRYVSFSTEGRDLHLGEFTYWARNSLNIPANIEGYKKK